MAARAAAEMEMKMINPEAQKVYVKVPELHLEHASLAHAARPTKLARGLYGCSQPERRIAKTENWHLCKYKGNQNELIVLD